MRFIGLCAGLLLTATTSFGANEDLLIADFESETYGTWQVTGAAFGPAPRGTLPNQMPVEGFEGRGLVNSFFKGDASVGTLTSPDFTIQRRFLNFLIGGGKHEGQTCLNLLVGGQIVRTATGPNEKPGGTERLDWDSWDISDLIGKTARVQIVDQATGGWGHINVDQIVQSNQSRSTQPARRTIKLTGRYLQFWVKNGAPKRRLKLIVDGRTVREIEIELAEQEPDFSVFADLKPYQGRELTLETKLPAESRALDLVVSTDTPGIAADAGRPAYHFTSQRGWLNDPNGLVFLKGEWHLFYQHNPYGWSWGNMHWGHAVSKDLLHWDELPTALFPKAWGDWAFSGSAVVDRNNTSGFKTGDEDVLVAAFTSTGRGECIAFSNDRGRTWTEYDQNPVVKHAGRDPKVIWHEPTHRWVMAVYDERPNQPQSIAFYTSPNLKEWTFASRIDGFFECPDLFSLPVDGQGTRQWVLYAADGKYMIGAFDGRTFTRESGKHQVWYGNFYAAQTFSDVPDGRRIQIGWANGIEFPGKSFNQQMTIPVELTLRTTADGVRMFAWPVREVEQARAGPSPATVLTGDHLKLQPGPAVTITGPSTALDLFDLTLELEPGQAKQITLTVRGTPIVYRATEQTLTCRHVTAPAPLRDGKLRLRVLGDRGSLEVFVNAGEVALSVADKPSADDRTLKAAAEGGEALLWRPEIGILK